ncbi:MAG: SIS domain-containing protein [Patescibacteria group bacterium]
MKLDSQNMLGSLLKLADQIEQIAEEARELKLPVSYKKTKKIVFFGMGGSALGAHCISSIYKKDLKLPAEIVNDYDAPGMVDRDTLAIAVSYSGGTEETLSALRAAHKRGAKLVVVTSGGELARYAGANKIPALIFKINNNPCGSPRMGLGYTTFGPLLILSKLGLLKISIAQIKEAVAVVRRCQDSFGTGNNGGQNAAKLFAGNLLTGNVWFVGAEHLSGNVHIAANQLNENAKRFGGYFLIPELNHHLLEGLSFPAGGPGTFVFIESSKYSPRVQKRFAVTKEILKKSKLSYISYQCSEQKALLQSMEILVLSSYLSFYLAILEGIDPTAIPTVNFLKSALKKS